MRFLVPGTWDLRHPVGRAQRCPGEEINRGLCPLFFFTKDKQIFFSILVLVENLDSKRRRHGGFRSVCESGRISLNLQSFALLFTYRKITKTYFNKSQKFCLSFSRPGVSKLMSPPALGRAQRCPKRYIRSFAPFLFF